MAKNLHTQPYIRSFIQLGLYTSIASTSFIASPLYSSVFLAADGLLRLKGKGGYLTDRLLRYISELHLEKQTDIWLKDFQFSSEEQKKEHKKMSKEIIYAALHIYHPHLLEFNQEAKINVQDFVLKYPNDYQKIFKACDAYLQSQGMSMKAAALLSSFSFRDNSCAQLVSAAKDYSLSDLDMRFLKYFSTPKSKNNYKLSKPLVYRLYKQRLHNVFARDKTDYPPVSTTFLFATQEFIKANSHENVFLRNFFLSIETLPASVKNYLEFEKKAFAEQSVLEQQLQKKTKIENLKAIPKKNIQKI